MSNHFHRELDQLKRLILGLSTIACENVRFAVRSITRHDAVMAAQVYERDFLIPHKSANIEEECLKILALYQPVATDLRFVITVLKINSTLGRIGKHALNIAKKAQHLLKEPPTTSHTIDFKEMGDLVESILREAVDSMINLDLQQANDVLQHHQQAQRLQDKIRDQVISELETFPAAARSLHAKAGVARNLEGIADQAIMIAENVSFLITNNIIRHNPVEDSPPH